MPISETKYLTFIDIIILAFIFFGISAYSSLIYYFTPQQENQVVYENLSINDLASWQTTSIQLILLIIAWLYLRWRKFDFNILNFNLNVYTLPLTLLLIFGAGLFADIYQCLHATLFPEHFPETGQDYYQEIQYTLELIITSLVNGFFEEIFFMGLVFTVKPKALPRAVVFSLFVRFIFHTYQGIAGALTITTLGISFWLFRRKINVLMPFFLAHSAFDIFGLSLLGLVFSGEN